MKPAAAAVADVTPGVIAMFHGVSLRMPLVRSLAAGVAFASCAALAACGHAPATRDSAAPTAAAVASPAPASAAIVAPPSVAPAPSAPPAAPAYTFTRSIDATALAAARSAGETPLVLDVRSAAEFAEGHVPGAVNVPHDEVEARIAELAADRDRRIVLYCRSGRRAGMAAGVLQRHGFDDLMHLDGDMPGWIAAGLPVEKP